MEHLVICTNKDLRIDDWTPFSNSIGKHDLKKYPINIFQKGDLITRALNILSNYGWEYKSTFSDNKFLYFMVIRHGNIQNGNSEDNNTGEEVHIYDTLDSRLRVSKFEKK